MPSRTQAMGPESQKWDGMSWKMNLEQVWGKHVLCLWGFICPAFERWWAKVTLWPLWGYCLRLVEPSNLWTDLSWQFHELFCGTWIMGAVLFQFSNQIRFENCSSIPYSRHCQHPCCFPQALLVSVLGCTSNCLYLQLCLSLSVHVWKTPVSARQLMTITNTPPRPSNRSPQPMTCQSWCIHGITHRHEPMPSLRAPLGWSSSHLWTTCLITPPLGCIPCPVSLYFSARVLGIISQINSLCLNPSVKACFWCDPSQHSCSKNSCF